MSVTPDKIAVALGRAAPEPDSVTWSQWQMWIDDAQMLIDTRVQKMGVEPPSENLVDYVIREAVVAQVRKPDDSTQVTISVDDGSSSRTYQSSKGRVTIVDEWWTLLGLVETEEGAYAIDAAPGARNMHLPWCALMWNATYCSCGADIAGRPIYELGGGW